IKDANINEEYDFKEEDSKDRDVTKSSKNETIANINFKWKTLVVVVLIISLTSGLLGSYIGIRMFASNYYPNSNNQQQITINPNDSYTTVSAVVQKSMSSVVGITTVEVKDHLFAQQLVNGIGSGIIVDSNGYILTNSHVISDGNAREINVLFENGE
ncbi:2-alkenal reductase, partial [Vibrio parahaemolyticus]|nr:2-alkenal reductase [Vibrio parahaemolyticus]